MILFILVESKNLHIFIFNSSRKIQFYKNCLGFCIKDNFSLYSMWNMDQRTSQSRFYMVAIYLLRLILHSTSRKFLYVEDILFYSSCMARPGHPNFWNFLHMLLIRSIPPQFLNRVLQINRILGRKPAIPSSTS